MDLLGALKYGVPGLCAIMLIVVANIVRTEQRRPGSPRAGILQFGRLFMLFCVILAGLNFWAQSAAMENTAKAELRTQRDAALADLDRVRSAAGPLLSVREDIIAQLPDSLPQKELLVSVVQRLRGILNTRP